MYVDSPRFCEVTQTLPRFYGKADEPYKSELQ